MRTTLHERSSALASETRCEMLTTLAKVRQMTVGLLAEVNGLRPSVCSKHLEILAQAGFVEKIESGKYVYASLCEEGLRDYMYQLNEFLAQPEDPIWGQ